MWQPLEKRYSTNSLWHYLDSNTAALCSPDLSGFALILRRRNSAGRFAANEAHFVDSPVCDISRPFSPYPDER